MNDTRKDILERLEQAAKNSKFYNARQLYLEAKAEIERLRTEKGIQLQITKGAVNGQI